MGDRQYDEYTIKHDRDHYILYINNIFYCSADTLGEAVREMEKHSALRRLRG